MYLIVSYLHHRFDSDADLSDDEGNAAETAVEKPKKGSRAVSNSDPWLCGTVEGGKIWSQLFFVMF